MEHNNSLKSGIPTLPWWTSKLSLPLTVLSMLKKLFKYHSFIQWGTELRI